MCETRGPVHTSHLRGNHCAETHGSLYVHVEGDGHDGHGGVFHVHVDHGFFNDRRFEKAPASLENDDCTDKRKSKLIKVDFFSRL